MIRLFLPLLLLLVACTSGPEETEPPRTDPNDTRAKSVAALLQESGRADAFVRALRRENLWEQVTGSTPVTVIAPPDAALDQAVRRTDTTFVRADTARAILEHHLVRGIRLPARVGDSLLVSAMDARPLLLQRTDSGFTANGVRLSNPVRAYDGLLYFADDLLRPPLEARSTPALRPNER